MVMENPCNPWLTSVAAWPRCVLRVSAVKFPTREFFADGEQLRLLQKKERPIESVRFSTPRGLCHLSAGDGNPNQIRIDPNNGTGD